MKEDRSKIDALIAEAFNEKETEFLKSLEEESFQDVVSVMFKGRYGWLAVLNTVISFLLFGFFVWFCIEFFKATDSETMLKWGFGSIFTLSGMVMIKIMGWMNLNKLALMREIKRLELQLAILAEKITDKDQS